MCLKKIVGWAVIIVCWFLASVSAYSFSYCTPKDQCWPNASAIGSFKDSLDGYVIQPGDREYKNLTYMKYLSYTRNPGLIVLVLTADDVKKTLAFAHQNNIKLAVLSSAHDFNGRSTVEGGLQISFWLFNNVTVNMTDSASPTGYSVTAQAGAQWIKVYTEVDKFKKQVVGGSAQTVSVSGYTMGGGHSPLTRSYGLAVDDVISFDMILSNGTRVWCTAKGTTYEQKGEMWQSSETDLFWAVRGGGGGTFGVLLSFTFTIHDAPPGLVRYQAMYPIDVYGDNTIGKEVYKILFKLLKKLPKEWGGYVRDTFIVDPKGVSTGVIMITLIQNAPWESPTTRAIDELVNFKPEYKVYSILTNYTTFLEYEATINDPVYIWALVANSFIRASEVNQNHIDFFSKTAVKPRVAETSPGCTWTLIGGNGRFAQAANDSAVSADFRAADISMSCYVSYKGAWQQDAVEKDIVYIDTMLDLLGRGAYLNEAAFGAKNWKQRFWGDKYERLVKIKRKYDPDGRLTCHHCVDSHSMTTSASVFLSVFAFIYVKISM